MGYDILKAAFPYASSFRAALASLKQEGRYRVFADIVRERGAYPKAEVRDEGCKRPITVWCSNDYLNMGQHPKVLAAMHQALDGVGAGRAVPATYPAPAIIMSNWSGNWPTCMARKRACYSLPAMCPMTPRSPPWRSSCPA